ncbi:MAG: 1,2-phenylacetyl-CoA epoxidase subunit PaaD [Ginsengibacter sp.]
MEKIDQNTANESSSKEKIWNILSSVNDPEIPVLSVLNLGIVRDVKMKDEEVEVVITPTYSGCPAIDFIGMNIRKSLLENGFKNIKITHQLSPAWTTDWMTNEGKEKLKAYGIAPPVAKTFDKNNLENQIVECPHCGLKNTKLISEFGSTACKALYKCVDCGEPFDYFKCH